MSEIQSGSQSRMEKVLEIAEYLKENPEEKASDVIETISFEYGVVPDKARQYYNSAKRCIKNQGKFLIRRKERLTEEEKEELAIQDIDNALEKDLKMCNLKRK